MRSIVIILATIWAAAPFPAVAQTGNGQAAPPPPCESAAHRQMDFWVGRWDVYRSDTNALVARSLIESLYGGCAVRENWMPVNGGGTGGSLNAYRPTEGRWRQIYTGSFNGWTEYAGGMQGDDFVLTQLAAPGTANLIRMTYRRAADGAVLQIGERTTDGGQSWQLQYHFTYRRAAES